MKTLKTLLFFEICVFIGLLSIYIVYTIPEQQPLSPIRSLPIASCQEGKADIIPLVPNQNIQEYHPDSFSEDKWTVSINDCNIVSFKYFFGALGQCPNEVVSYNYYQKYCRQYKIDNIFDDKSYNYAICVVNLQIEPSNNNDLKLELVHAQCTDTVTIVYHPVGSTSKESQQVFICIPTTAKVGTPVNAAEGYNTLF